jgi:hypothetical protein
MNGIKLRNADYSTPYYKQGFSSNSPALPNEEMIVLWENIKNELITLDEILKPKEKGQFPGDSSPL